jgi:hypothetical protein
VRVSFHEKIMAARASPDGHRRNSRTTPAYLDQVCLALAVYDEALSCIQIELERAGIEFVDNSDVGVRIVKQANDVR